MLLLFAIYGRLFALMLPNDRVEAGAGSLFLETVSHNKTVSYDKTFQASDTPLLWSGASAPSRELRCPAASCSVWGQSPAHRATDYTELATTTTNNTLLLCHGSQIVCSVLSFQCPKGFQCMCSKIVIFNIYPRILSEHGIILIKEIKVSFHLFYII